MDKDTKNAITIVVTSVVIIVGLLLGVSYASGVSPPQTVVESGSMQHGIGSQFGIIDTGDVIILKNKEKVNIQSYVEGYATGYISFGSYGDVIVYDRGSQNNPVIHRAILWLDYNGNGTWSAPSLENYPSDLWSCTKSSNYMELSGILTMKNMGYGNNINASINLDSLINISQNSGYLTMGDNNTGFDQPSNITGVSGLITYDKIKSVAWLEIPWIGTFKMALNGKMDAIDIWVPNTVPSLVATSLLIIFFLIGISFLFDYRYYEKYRKELKNRMNAPTPIFLLENKKK